MLRWSDYIKTENRCKTKPNTLFVGMIKESFKKDDELK